MTLIDSLVRGNKAFVGGGIHSEGLGGTSAVALTDASFVTGNTAGSNGGGIWNDDDPENGVGTVTLDATSSVTGNTPDWQPARIAGVWRRSVAVYPDEGGSFSEIWRASWLAGTTRERSRRHRADRGGVREHRSGSSWDWSGAGHRLGSSSSTAAPP